MTTSTRGVPLRPFAFVVLVALSLTGAFAWWAGSLERGEESLIQRRYAEAVTHLRAALDESPTDEHDRILLLLGRAQWLAGDVPGAVASYRDLLTRFADSPLVYKAKLQQAEALASARRFDEAAVLYREEIARLTGAERKEEVAQTYLGLADRAAASEPPDWARAVSFYDLALDLGLSDGTERSVRLLAAEAALRGGDHGGAIQRFGPLVEQLTVEQGRLRAMLGLGRARNASGDRAAARTVLRDLMAAASENADEAADAAWEIAKTYGVPKPSGGELDLALRALADLAERFPEHRQAQVADYLAARCLQHNGRSEDALASLRRFLARLETAPELATRDELPQARAMVGDVLFSQGRLVDAIDAWKQFLAAHPANEAWERVQRAIVDAEFARADQAWRAGKERFGEARELFDAFARAHPLDQRNPQILLLFGEMLLAEKKYDEARAAYERCVSKYPGKDPSSRAQFRIGEIFERKTFNYDKALAAYRAVTWGSWSGQAQMRIRRLEQKHLALLTKRSFRSGEPASFELTSRNIEEVRVRIYRLDLETWFRATHLPGEVERLDIEVIEPDRTFQSSVPDYQRYRETSRDVAVEFAEPGAYVVKVDDAELEATTLVIVTDLAMIAKSSRHEFFVLAQNVKEDRVTPGARVVLSDCSKIVAEGTTGADGVWRYRGDALRNVEELRAFVVDASGSGASTLSLSGLGYSPGLTAKGYLFTDRPIYEPGHVVHAKGIIREVESGLYRLPSEDGYRVRVVSASGRTVLQRQVDFTAFGTFAVDVPLPAEAELGAWLLQVERSKDGAVVDTFTGSFEVSRYELPRVSLTAKPEQPVVFRGERIEGEFELRYFYGEPAVGKTISYALQLPNGAVVNGQGETNATGAVPFSFDTKEFGEEGVARITARVAEENATTQLFVPVVTTEFTPSVGVVRDVYLVGEAMDVKVSIADRSGKPLARPATVKLFRREKRNRRTAEVEVARAELRTDADGVGTASLTAEQGGPHFVRVEATDRFDNVVTATAAVTVSGEDDRIKLRILSDRERFEVGDEMAVRVVNRAAAKLALLTVQGDGVLSYETRRIPVGESEIRVALEALHAPNFALALAMVDGRELHTAQREFLVARDLRVDVTPRRAEVRPGEEVTLDVETADPTGKPVAAEVAIALVDESVFAVRADPAAPIGAFFYGQRRETDFRTTSSCTWSYRGPSVRVSQELVAEARRLEELEEAPVEEKAAGSDDFFMGARGRPRRGGRGPRAGGGGAPGPGGPSTPGPQTGAAATGGGGGESVFGRRVQSLANGADRGLRRELQDQLRAGLEVQQGVVDQEGLALFYELPQAVDGDGRARFGFALDRLGELDSARAPLDAPRTNFSELGGWLSAVETDADGKATVRISMPQSTTGWRLTARAVTTDTWVGDGRADVRTAKPLQVGVLVPHGLVEGDESEIATRVHNRTGAAQRVDVSLETRRGAEGDVETDQQTLELEAGREGNGTRRLVARGTEDLTVTLTASATGAADARDAVERTVPVQAFGVEKVVARSGRLTQSDRFELGLPAGREYAGLGMRIEVGPNPGRELVTAALGNGYRPRHCTQLDLSHLSIASRGLAALRALEWIERAGAAIPADRSRLESLVEGSISALVTAQREDGGFAWVNRMRSRRGSVDGEVRTTAQAVRFLAAARRAGQTSAQAGLDQAVEWLLQRLRGANPTDRSQIALALSAAGRSRFETLNTLHRQRNGMALVDLARLALAWQSAGRREMAAEALTVLRGKLRLDAERDAATIEAVGLAAAALLANDGKDTTGQRAVDWLRNRRQGATWGTPTATAAALEALVAAGGPDLAVTQTAEVDVVVNGRALATIPSNVPTGVATFDVPTDWLTSDANAVQLDLRGQGTAHYSVVLTGFAAGFDASDRNDEVVRTRRKYLAALRRHDGKVLRPGFGVVNGRYQSFENLMTELPVGRSGRVETSFWVRRESDRERYSPLVVVEPVPAGATVLRDTVQGNFEQVVYEPNRIVFHYRAGVTNDTVRYELQGRFPGRYRALPTKVFGALRPDLVAHGPVGELSVLGRGEKSSDEYRLTPDELYHLGKALFDAGDFVGAGAHLDTLLAGWKLDDAPAREVARMMLFVSIERGDSRAVVRFFEELKERYADLVIPFDKILAVGQSYIDIGEFEAALLVFRATAEASFLKEAAIAKTLENKGEVKAALRFLRRLLDAYPDLNTMRASLYGIGQQLAELAAKIPDGARVDPRVGARDELRRAALRTFRDFLVVYPEDPLAEEVSFAWATTLIEGRDLEGARDVANAALSRYPNSPLEDELLYTVGYTHFVLGQSDDAFALLDRVASERFVGTRGGGRGPSENRSHALYLQGQIHHALGVPEKALAKYDTVKDQFSDAGEAADYFRAKRLAIPEVSAFGLDEDVVLKVDYRNLPTVDVKVYRVDLMRLYILHKSLNDIRGIQLHGIAPFAEVSRDLGDGKDYEDRTAKLELALGEPGAYLVVARSGDLLASGMILRTDLEIETQESHDVGRIRVNVKRDGAFLGNAHVKVVGSGGDRELKSGDTDLRGIFVADGLVGTATVIVRHEEEFAFYRGKAIHQPARFRPPAPQPSLSPAGPKKKYKGRAFDAWENNLNLNGSNRGRQIQWLQKQVLDKQQRGVEVYRAK